MKIISQSFSHENARIYSLTSVHPDKSVSPVLAEILMIAIILILAVLVLLLFHLPSFEFGTSKPPTFLQIKSVYHVNEYGYLNYDSRVILIHNGTESYENNNLFAVFYRNGEEVSCNIETMNGYDFISSPHYGVQTMGGTGCSGSCWSPHEKIALDFTDSTYHPGDLIKVEIFQRPLNKLISSHSYTA